MLGARAWLTMGWLWAALTLLLLATVARGDKDCEEWTRIQVPGVSPVLLTVTPRMPTDGQVLELSCVISANYSTALDASRLYISKGAYYNASHTNVETHSDGIVLRVPHAERSEWTGVVHCYIYGIDFLSCIARTLGFLNIGNVSAHITFRRDPLPILFERCEVDNWERLECQWSPSRQDQKNHTLTQHTDHNFTYSLIYHIVGDNKQHTCTCPEALADEQTFCTQEQGALYLDQRCVLKRDQFLMGQVYNLVVRGQTEHGLREEWSWADQYEQDLNTSLFVRPSPPTALTHSSISPSLATLNWARPQTSWLPAADWQLSYTVTVQDNWNRAATIVQTIHTTADISTDPYTEYTWTLTAAPVHQGHESSPALDTFTTQSTAPVVSPVVSSASYEFVGEETVQVYWKPIQAWEQGGEDFVYIVTTLEVMPAPGPKGGSRRRRDYTEDNKTLPTANRQLSVRGHTASSVTISVTMDTHLTVTPKNSIGVGEPSQAVHILIKPVAMTTEQLLVEVHSETTVVTFSVRQAEPRASYIICWKSEEGLEPVDWYVLDAPHSSRKVKLPSKYTKYQYALARISDGTNTGMDWTRTEITLYDGLSAAVDIGNVYDSATEHEIELRWHAPISEGHITQYKIHYCRCSSAEDGCHAGYHDTTRTVDGGTLEVTLVGLARDEMYCININSHTRSGSSPDSATLAVPTQPGVSPAIIAGVTVGAIIVLILSVLGVYKIYRKCHKVKTWYTSGYKVELPPEPQTADSASSDTPFLHYSFHSNKYRDPHYHRAMSSMSGASIDSGQFSLAAMDDCMSTDELTLSCNSMINSYTRTGYVASPTQLRSIPEDGDSGDVFDSNQSKFVQTYQVTPEMSAGEQLSTLEQGQGHADSNQSKNGIGSYAAIAIQPGFSPDEPVVKFKNGLDGKLEESPCQYSVIQVPSKSGNQRDHGKLSSKQQAKGNSDYIRPEDFMDGMKGAVPKLRMPPVGGYVTNPALASTGRGHSGRNASKQANGYIPNDGSFNAQASIPRILEPRPATVGNYMPNDGSFNPQTSIEPKATMGDSFLPNDGSFVPQSRTVHNTGTTDNIATVGYVANDGSFEPSCPQSVGKCMSQTIAQEPIDYVRQEGLATVGSSKSMTDRSPYVGHEALKAVGQIPSTGEQPDTDPAVRPEQTADPFNLGVSMETDQSVQSVPASDPEAFSSPIRSSVKDPLSKAKSLMALSDGRSLSRASSGASHSRSPQARPQSLTMSSVRTPSQPSAASSFSELRPYHAHSGSVSDGSTARLGSTDTSGHGSGTHLEGGDLGHGGDLGCYVSHGDVCPDSRSQQTNSTSDFEETCSTLSEDSDIIHSPTPTKPAQHRVNGYLAHPGPVSVSLPDDNSNISSNAHNNAAERYGLPQSANALSSQDNNNMVKDQLVGGCYGNHVRGRDSVGCVSDQFTEHQQKSCVTAGQLNDRQTNGYVTLPV